ncbi:uncharacterized protein LOC124311080 [Daphnia pulicaria]|uniref:uncharacterized protein LOC124311080 n=1 Tax=Daphnia pulicaria TaxID=35523 RepID=UPI001EEB1F23|nr:uncharacterized protein LOC124311080 [Daphnia pulicaria]
MDTDMEEISTDTDFCYKIPRWNFPTHYLNYDRYNQLKTKSLTDDDEREKFVLVRRIHPNVFKIVENYDSYKRREYTHFRGECTTLNKIWRSDKKKKLLPDHFTAILQLALGLEYLHSQKLIHGDIKPENVVICNSGTEITLKWAYFESPSRYDKSKKVDIQEQTNKQKVSDRIDQLMQKGEEKLESETNIEKATGSTFSIEHEKNPQKTTDETHTIKQKLQDKEESKINIEKGTEKMSDIDTKKFLMFETKFFTDKRSRTWQAPELQTLSNPRTLATFESDVFAAGLVFGSLLLNGAHPFGVDEDKIISNIKMNEPVNVKKMESKRVTELILQMLTYKKEERIITSSDVVEQMQLIQKEILEIPTLIDELGKKTIIPWYCRFNHQEKNVIQTLQLLIANGGDVNSVDENGNNALQIMCNFYKLENLIELIQLLIENGIKVNCENRYGDNALTLLCASYKNENLIDIIRLLIENGIEVNCKTKYGNALTSLCRNYQIENLIDIIRLLIENGIEINFKDTNGWNVLTLLCCHYRKENLIEIIQHLINNGIEVNCKNHHGDNALTTLCEYYKNENLIEIIQLFIEKRIDINFKTKSGDNALTKLCTYTNKDENLIDIIRLLIKNRIEINCNNNYGDNALIKLCEYYKNENLIEIIQLFIENGIDINNKNIFGENAFTLLCGNYKKENLIEIIQLFIENGIDINCKNNKGDNALTKLCKYYKNENLIDIIRLLIENGIDIHLKVNHSENVCLYVLENFKDKTPLDEVIKLLIRHGIQFSSKCCKKLQECGMENQIGGLEILKYMAEEELSLGWHPNCSSCNHIISIEESARRQAQHHQMFGNAFVAYHMILKDLQAWQKSTQKSVADQDEPNPGKLCEEAQNHFTTSEDQECFKTMVEIGEQMKGGDSSLFQCDLYEHYMRSLHSIARIIGAEKSKKQIEFFYLLPFDYSLTFPADKKDDPEFKTALSEWDKTLFCWMHKPGNDYFGKTLKKDSMKGLFSSVNYSLNCHGQQRKKQ